MYGDTQVAAQKPFRHLSVAQSVKGAGAGLALLVLAACQTNGANGTNGLLNTSDSQEMDGIVRTLYQAGREAEASNNFEEAASIYGRLYEKRSDDPAVLAAYIRNMRYVGRAAEISNFVGSRAQDLLENQHVKFEYAKALLVAGRKKDSLAALQQVQTQMPDNWRVHSALGIAYDGFGRFDDAVAAYDTALQLSPDNTVVMNNLAMSQAMTGQLSAAIKTLKRAATLNRTNSQIRQNLALLYAINGDVEHARSLAAMDLNASDLETNLSFYRRFEGVGQ